MHWALGWSPDHGYCYVLGWNVYLNLKCVNSLNLLNVHSNLVINWLFHDVLLGSNTDFILFRTKTNQTRIILQRLLWLWLTLRMILCFRAAGDGISLELGSIGCERRQSRIKRTSTTSCSKSTHKRICPISSDLDLMLGQ